MEDMQVKADPYAANAEIKRLATVFKTQRTEQVLLGVLFSIAARIEEEGEAPTPTVDKSGFFNELDFETIKVNETITTDKPIRLVIDQMQDGAGRLWIPLFTDNDEVSKGQTANVVMNLPIRNLLESAYGMEKVEGLVINPFGDAMTLPKSLLQIIVNELKAREENK